MAPDYAMQGKSVRKCLNAMDMGDNSIRNSPNFALACMSVYLQRLFVRHPWQG